ncbi:hypothetical protein ABID82_004256 [Methylobacterium sp. PvP062]|uniref:Uncharacterized protein n=1 Tax=Methylobacterium radiotolerans TaxID=31998 RepID=A0ABV2NL75_9HYPH|nr:MULTISPECIES: hypothetical protein [unclassified Methylobacterium]KZC01420.1 hypothetical protein AU375_02344 [Methylobacterium radiotolerans]MBP2496018.1 hypothetical protein [Methylobacterium sp. PvP105]MBP2504111.1 hypothetical protein [Methylobacterium sp. PvP109]MCX7333099.1 hypothetical protein [Hyphomicrobiales bacterium]
MIRLAALIALGACLAGCQTDTVYVDRVQFVRPAIAPSLLSCSPEPAPPAPTAKMKAVAPYVVDLAQAGEDCRRKLDTVRACLSEPQPAPPVAPAELPAAETPAS